MYLTKGVLPVPPIVKLPTTITGTSDLCVSETPLRYFLLLLAVMYETINENGYNK